MRYSESKLQVYSLLVVLLIIGLGIAALIIPFVLTPSWAEMPQRVVLLAVILGVPYLGLLIHFSVEWYLQARKKSILSDLRYNLRRAVSKTERGSDVIETHQGPALVVSTLADGYQVDFVPAEGKTTLFKLDRSSFTIKDDPDVRISSEFIAALTAVMYGSTVGLYDEAFNPRPRKEYLTADDAFDAKRETTSSHSRDRR